VRDPRDTDLLDGVMEMLKSAGGATTSVAVAVWVREPLVPVTVRVEVPVGVPVPDVVTVMVELPDDVTETGLNEAVALPGSPVAANDTVPTKVVLGVTVTV